MIEDSRILIDCQGHLGIVTLNRPEVLNALSPEMLSAICDTLEEVSSESEVRALILTGNQRVFAAGADILVLADSSSADVIESSTIAYWQRLRLIEKPVIAAVSGYAYGGGFELALQCDLIVASDTARFAQPEIKLGIMPGAGGTQRLTKAIGPYRTMAMILTGKTLSGAEAFRFGLVNRLVPVERYLEEATELGAVIASQPQVAVRLARQTLRFGVDHTLKQGLEVERRNFTRLFDTYEQAEDMRAFLEKRPAVFRGE